MPNSEKNPRKRSNTVSDSIKIKDINIRIFNRQGWWDEFQKKEMGILIKIFENWNYLLNLYINFCRLFWKGDYL